MASMTLRIRPVVLALVAAWLLLLPGPARAAPGDIMLEIMGAEVSWANREYVGHAFLCIALHLNSGIKEDCYGFYPASTTAVGRVSGPGVVSGEVGRNPTRFARVGAAAKRTITEDQRRAVLRAIDGWNARNYNLTDTNCIDLVHEVAGVVGMRRPDRGATQLPLAYVRELDRLN